MFQSRSLFPKRELPALQEELSNVGAAVGKCATGFPPTVFFFFFKISSLLSQKNMEQKFQMYQS